MWRSFPASNDVIITALQPGVMAVLLNERNPRMIKTCILKCVEDTVLFVLGN